MTSRKKKTIETPTGMKITELGRTLNEPEKALHAIGQCEVDPSTEILQHLRRQQEALRESESCLRAVLTASQDAIVIADNEGVCVETNPAAERITGISEDLLVGRRLSEFIEPGGECERVWCNFKQEGCYQGEFAIARPDGARLLVEIYAVANIRPGRHLAVLRDITKRRRAEELQMAAQRILEQQVSDRTTELGGVVNELRSEIQRREEAELQLQQTNQILRMLSECNEAIVRIDDEPKLMREVCEIAIRVGGYRMAWVGMREDNREKTVRPVAWAGHEEGFLKTAAITWADDDRGKGPTGTAIRTGTIQFGRDFQTDPNLAPLRDEALQRGFRSSIALPLKQGGQVFGSLTIYTAGTLAFTDSQLRALSDLADDLAYGLVALRTRQALRESRDRLRALAGELTLAEQRERQRLAQILHDHIQQLLVGAKFRLHALRVGNETAENQIKEIGELINECIQSTRTLTAELSPPVLHVGGFSESLEWLADWMEDKHGLKVDLELQEEAMVEPKLKVLLFESVRELLFNVVKHAKVKSATVRLRRIHGDQLEIVVADKGVGLDRRKLSSEPSHSAYGLFSIRQRIKLLGGQMAINSQAGKGTRLTLTVPVTPTTNRPL